MRIDDNKLYRFPRMKDGEAITPRHFNVVYAFLEDMSRHLGMGQFRRHGFVAVTTSAITAASGSTLGKGSAKIFRLYEDGDDLKRGDTDVEMRVYNLAAEEVPTGKIVQVKRVDGFMLVDFELCDA